MKKNSKNELSLIPFIFVTIILVLIFSLTACNKQTDVKLSFIVDDELYHVIDLLENDTIILPDNPTKEGYVFEGWFWEDGRAFTIDSIKETPLEGDLSVYARWHLESETSQEYTVTFNVIGGGDVPSQSVVYDGIVAKPENPIRTGHILVGWFTDADCITRWDFSNSKVKANITLYAKWVSETDMNNADIIKSEGLTMTGNSLRVTVPASQEQYRAFDNLEANPYATIRVYKDDQGIQEIGLGLINLEYGDNIVYVLVASGSGTVKKIYTLTVHRNRMFNVTFNYGNEDSVDSIVVEEGNVVQFHSAGNKEGYRFIEWQKDGLKWSLDIDTVEEDIELVAIWQANTYEIDFDSNSGSFIESKDVNFDDEYIFNVPIRNHYVFKGWQTASGRLLTDASGESLSTWDITEDVTLFANWELCVYTITYTNTYNVENTNATEFTYETEAFNLTALTNTDRLRFVKWTYNDAEITSVSGNIGSSITITAVWDYIQYNLEFYLGDGYYNVGESNPNSYNESEEIVFVKPIANKLGYEFDGWYDAITDGSKHIGISFGSVDDRTYYARYKAVNYEITYQGANGLNNANPINYTVDTPTITLNNLLGRNGYLFKEWQNTNGDKVSKIEKGSIGHITLVAVWDLEIYDITYNNTFNIAHSNPTDYTVETNTINLVGLTGRNGYKFMGWYNSPTDGIKLTEILAGSYGNLDLYARWSLIEYDIEYIGIYDATNLNPSKYTVESTFEFISPTGRVGYSFLEWQDVSGIVITAVPSGTTGKLEIRAIWSLDTYDINYYDTRTMPHSNPSNYTYVSEDRVLDSLDDCTGYRFLGWYTAPMSGTKVIKIPKGSYGDIDLYARWEAKVYGVSLDRESSINSFTVSFSGNGYELDIPQQYIGDGINLYYPNIPEREGYIFAGWYDNSECMDSPYDFTKEIKTDIVLYAKWVASSSSIKIGDTKSFYLYGRTYFNYDFIPLVSGNINAYTTGSVDTYGYLYQNDSQIISNDDAGGGINFSYTYNVTAGVKYTIKVRGYSSNSIGSTTLHLNGTLKPSAGGAIVPNNNTIDVLYGTQYDLGIPEGLQGYTFLGWYTGIDCGGIKLTDDTGVSLNPWTIDENIVVYSGYQKILYTVTFKTNAGSPITTDSLYYGERLNLNERVTTREGYSFVGWYVNVDDTSPYEATTMPAYNLILNAKWVVYNLNDFKYNTEKFEIREEDIVSASLFNAELFDSDGDLVEIEATVNGTQTAGETVSIRLLASGKYNKKKQVTINDIKVYGIPSISYDDTKDYFNLGALNSDWFSVSGMDTYGIATSTDVSVKESTYSAGDLVTVVLTSIDIAGNENKVELINIKVYGEPNISYASTKTNIKVSDTVNNDLWTVLATDSFDVPLVATTEIISGTKVAGNTITVKISSTDSKGNTRDIAFNVKVYGYPAIGVASRTNFKVTDEITIDSLGIVALDSHNATVENVGANVKNGVQIAGTTMEYTITAIDFLGNVSTKDITVKVFEEPIFSPQTKDKIKISDNVNYIDLFDVSAKDSFNNPLTVTHTLKNGVQQGGTSMVYTFTVMDAAGNIASVDYAYKVYDADDIIIIYNALASNLVKNTSKGEEFLVDAVDSFGAPCSITLMNANGSGLSPGTVADIKFRATDILGNYKDTSIIFGISIYAIPTATYMHSHYYLKADDNIEFMFEVKDSFGMELYAEITQVSYSDDVRKVRVVSTDDAGNCFDKTYELLQLSATQSYLVLCRNTEYLGYKVVNREETYTLPIDYVGYDEIYGWKLDGNFITDALGNSLSIWDKLSGEYDVQIDGKFTTYTVAYNLNGGTNDENNPASFTLMDLGGQEGTITLKPPKKITNTQTVSSTYMGNGVFENSVKITQHTFEGWFKDSAFTSEVTELSITIGSIVVYAKWSSSVSYTYTTTTSIVYQRINALGEPAVNGGFILFGEYPQTLKASDVTITTTQDSRGYYLGGDGFYYAKVVATPYNIHTYYKFSNNTTFVTPGTTYYFKVEPIKWRILSITNGKALILCDSIIANRRYRKSNNNYKISEIRAWLNNEFYNTTFSELQKRLIQITEVDNSSYTTGFANNPHACENTNDRIFLPSYRDMVNTSYGFCGQRNEYDEARRFLTSDYTRATGAWMAMDSDHQGNYYGNGDFLLRSPYYYESPYVYDYVSSVASRGYIGFQGVDFENAGVVPALVIGL